MSAELALLGVAAGVGYQASKEAVKITGEIVRAIVLLPAGEVGMRLRDEVRAYLEPKVDRAVETVVDATRKLEAAGLAPVAVPGRLLFPLLQAAAVEEDDSLRAMWSTLLANAGDRRQQRPASASFVSILRDLSPIEARLLAAIHQPKKDDLVEFELNPDGRSVIYISDDPGFHEARILVSEDDFKVVTDNLARLGLVETFFGGPTTSGSVLTRKTYRELTLSPLGRRFIEACVEPPRPHDVAADEQTRLPRPYRARRTGSEKDQEGRSGAATQDGHTDER